MDTSRLEALLEQLIDKQDELISRIESLEATVEQYLTEANASISELGSFPITGAAIITHRAP